MIKFMLLILVSVVAVFPDLLGWIILGIILSIISIPILINNKHFLPKIRPLVKSGLFYWR